MKGLNGKVSDLERAAAQRKAKLDENSAFLQFNWKADVVESWIGEQLQQVLEFLVPQGKRVVPRATACVFPCSRFSSITNKLIKCGSECLPPEPAIAVPGTSWGAIQLPGADIRAHATLVALVAQREVQPGCRGRQPDVKSRGLLVTSKFKCEQNNSWHQSCHSLF